MEGSSGMKNLVSYVAWLLSSIWRRKNSVFGLLLGTAFILLCIQYNITKDVLESFPRQELELDNSVATLSTPKERVKTVQFVHDDGIPTSRGELVNVLGKIVNESPDAYYSKLMDGQRKRTLQIGRRLDKGRYIPIRRIVHIDLKGAPPKVAYLKEIFALVKRLGATGILLEWEDMFPWQDNLANLAARNAYTRAEAKEIIGAAAKYDLDVIPLVQTFGHLEFALKNAEFAHLREVPESPQALCPSLNTSLQFVQDMIDQVMRLHRNSAYLHIGCDEVFHVGECSRCRTKIREELFLGHVKRVGNYVRKKYPYTTPIIWDDMLRHLPANWLESSDIGKIVEPMVWVYAEDVYRFVPQTIWDKYEQIFPYAWTASAFKGAFGETYYIPNVKRHLENNVNWLSLMSAEEPKFKKGFRGIAITGWQRYDHFATLCETLPASIPSLAVNLAVVSHGSANNSLKEILYKQLNCGVVANAYSRSDSNFLSLDSDPFLWDQFSKCLFNGSHFYRMLYRLHSLEREIRDFLETTKLKKGWLTEYNVKRNFTSPLRVDELMTDESRLYHGVISLVEIANDSLKEIFDEYTVAEWIEQRIYPMIVLLEQLQKDAQRLKTVNVWPRRPLAPLNDLKRIGVTVLMGNVTH